jgi:hypothetical protein
MVLRSQREYLRSFPVGLYSWDPLRHFLDQNTGIANGTVKGTKINLQYLGVGDGLTVRSAAGASARATLNAHPRTR